MSIVKWVFGVGAMATVLAISGASSAWAESTLAIVKKRGELACGVNGSLPAFSYLDDKKERQGFDAEYCRAVAAAVLGDAKKVKFVALPLAKRFDALKSGEVDLLVRHSTISMERTAGGGVRYAAVTFIDGQAFVVPRKIGVSGLAGLDKKTVCVTKDTPHKLNVETWLNLRGLSATVTAFDDQDKMYEAFFAGKCDGVSQEATILASTVIASGKAGDFLMLPEIISREPLGPFVRNGDDNWYDIVHWTQNVMVEAEERGLRKATVDEDLASKDPAVRALLGVEPGEGRPIGLDDKWAYNIIKQVGNYAEVYDRNFGAGSPLKFGRGVNALWGKGGVMYSLPMH
jgi:general L-amino acid transport system substrate-binding protein